MTEVDWGGKKLEPDVDEDDLEEFVDGVPEELTEVVGTGTEIYSRRARERKTAEENYLPGKFSEEFLLMKRNVNGILSAYKKIYAEKQRSKPPWTLFLKKVTPPQDEPQAGHWGDVPEGGLSSQEKTAPCVLLPWRPSAGQDVEVGGSDIDDSDPMQADANVCF